MTEVTDIIRRFTAAEAIKNTMCGIWRDVGAQADPLNRNIGIDSASGATPSISGGADIFDSTISNAADVFAAGCLEWMTPYQTKWAAFSAPRHLQGDDVAKSWYSKCTDIAFDILAGTNFYSEIHDVYGMDGRYGTSGLMMREDSRYGLHFDSLQIGQFSILEDSRRNVDTLFEVRNYSPRQAAQEFGEGNLPEEVRKCLGDPKKQDTEDGQYIHFIGPRTARDRFKKNIQNAPIASIWIEKKSQKIVKESGFTEQPFSVHRHLPFGRCPYGRSPGMKAIFDARQLNYMQKVLDTMVEKVVTPPVVAPSGYEGVIDLRAGGVSFEMNQGDLRQWREGGNYSIGEDRVGFRQLQINRSFHVDLFQVLGSVPVGKDLTAEEVRQRRNDSLPTFSPTFARKNRELNDPTMRMLFNTLLRLGAFPPPPESIVVQYEDGSAEVPDPEIVYSSKMALALKSIHNDAFSQSVAFAGQIAAIKPEILDNFDFDDGIRNYARNTGIQESSLMPERDRDEMRQQRAEAQARAEQEARQLEEADSASKLIPALSK